MEQLLKSLPEAALVLDELFLVVSCNEAAEHLFAHARLPLVGHRLEQLVFFENSKRLLEEIRDQCLENG